MGIVFRPPAPYVRSSRPLIFLAGPIQGAPDWQARAIEILSAVAPELDIASPRWLTFAPLDEEGKQAQYDWEIDHLEHAAKHGAILFWGACREVDVPGRSYAQTTRVEFGRYATLCGLGRAKLAVGAETAFHGRGYWARILDRFSPHVALRDTLDATCMDAIGRARKRFI